MHRWQLELAICDWDGTLFNSLPLAYGSVRRIFKVFGKKPPSLETYRDEITADFKQFYWRHGVPRRITPDEMNIIRAAYFKEHWQRAKLRANARDFLIFCRQRGLGTAIVSAEIPEVLRRRLKEFHLRDLIDHVHGAAWDKEKALIETLDSFGVKAENAFYLDDTFDGLTSAKHVGITTIGITSGYNTKRRIMAAKPDYPNQSYPSVQSLRAVMKIIRNEGR